MNEKESGKNLFNKKRLNQSEFWKATGYNLVGFVALWLVTTVLFFVIGAITEKLAPAIAGWDRPVVLVLWGLMAILFIFVQATLLSKRLKYEKRN